MNLKNKQFGELERVALRAGGWPTEAGDFTPWLAETENIELLGRTIGLELEVESQEQRVGLFRADILCKDTANQTWVLVENQLEKTDHIHLGQLMTYAAGLDAATIVSVAAEFRDEHRAALDWLNSITSDDFSFFGLEIELWRIGNSNPAPKFNVICKPNDWSRTVTKAAREASDGTSSQTGELQLEFWEGLRLLMESRGGAVNPAKAQASGFINFSIGKTGIFVTTTMSVQKKMLSVYLAVGTPQSIAYFKLLEKDRATYESEYGQELEWLELPGQKYKQVRVELNDVNPADKSQWGSMYDWIYDHLQRMHSTFSEAAKTIDPDEYVSDESDKEI
ncbi:DUF4268 domain-containing protein [Rhodopirellula europaea]|uniref:DUF4268 domain-containing protein n=1 Tax=Rhodopirellula europaea SH398 TaxID=1263868 RepID=M5S758_9BACT|nr:DUF4268 domain-containing protein [Rhodopirellula europaea]EMI27320.1 hypothetical protein RESH_02052 [Rhodopirellula europaea SH398]